MAAGDLHAKSHVHDEEIQGLENITCGVYDAGEAFIQNMWLCGFLERVEADYSFYRR